MTYRYRDQATLMNIASVINVLAGLWLIGSPWLYAAAPTARASTGGTPIGAWNAMMVGFVVALFAVIRLASGHRTSPLSWVIAALGGWMVAAPWVIGYTENRPLTWNSIVVGSLVLVMAVISGMTGESIDEGEEDHRGEPTHGSEERDRRHIA